MNVIFMPLDAVLQWMLPLLPDVQRLGEWAVSGSALILIVLVLGAVLKGKLSCRVRYALWGVVLVRLLIPAQLITVPAAMFPSAPYSWPFYSPTSALPGACGGFGDRWKMRRGVCRCIWPMACPRPASSACSGPPSI